MKAGSGKRQFPEIRGKYLGQREPGLKPEVFAPGIISTNEYGEHSFPAFSPDYKEVYWSAYFRGQQTIFFMKTENGNWSPPKIAPFSGTYDDGNPSFSFDGKYLFFTTNKVPYLPYRGKSLTYDEIIKMFNAPQNGPSDIYWVDAKIIEELKPKELK